MNLYNHFKNRFSKALSAIVLPLLVLVSVPTSAFAAINTKLYSGTGCTGSEQNSFVVDTDVCAKSTGLGTDHVYHLAIFNPSNEIFTVSASATGNSDISFKPNVCGTWTASVVKDLDSSVVDSATFTVTGCTVSTFTLAYTAGANGSLTGSTTQVVNQGANGTAVTAVANPGFHFTSWSDASTDNPRTDNNIQTGISVTANFEADPVTPTATSTLTIIKTVINDNGRTATSSDFSLTLFDGSDTSTFPGSSTGTVFSWNATTTYAVGELASSTYNGSFDANCSGTLNPGESKTCVVTNNDIPVDPDNDADNDEILDDDDNCPINANTDQSDVDGDKIGDVCDPTDDRDTDEDGVLDTTDNCVSTPNTDQADNDKDGVGNVCDETPDGDVQTSGGGGSSGGGGGSTSGGRHRSIGGGGQVLGASIDDGSTDTCGAYLTEYLGKGKNNNLSEVVRLQLFLNEELGSRIPVTGSFGSMTEDAVRSFQLKYAADILGPWVAAGLHPDNNTPTGYVYKTTKRWINHIKCSTLDLPVPQLP